MSRVALVTGASSGIGAATARRLAADGYAVVVTARRADRLEALCEEIRAAGGVAEAVSGDVRDDVVIRTAVDRAAALGRLTVVVANAGLGYTGRFEEMTDEQLRHLVDVNILGVMRVVRHALPHLRASENGRVVIIGSVLSRVATTHNAVYCATKHAVVGFADALRLELRRDRIRVISILPGYTDTEFFDVQLRRDSRAIDGIKKFWFFHSPDAVADVVARRIEKPCAEVVVGGLNTAVVWVARRFPGFMNGMMTTVDVLMERLDERKSRAPEAARTEAARRRE